MQISPAHWHLLLNHFPVILSITGTGFLVAAFLFKKQHLKFGSMLILIVAALFTYPAFQTGEGAEHDIESIVGVSETAIERHEEIASTGMTVILITGAIALITLFLLHAKKKIAIVFMVITLLGALASAAVLSYVGYTGGEIRHSEIRGDFGGDRSLPPAAETEGNGSEQDD
jgi:uncharacterized membrane protein